MLLPKFTVSGDHVQVTDDTIVAETSIPTPEVVVEGETAVVVERMRRLVFRTSTHVPRVGYVPILLVFSVL
ncbi:hypothetical protein KIPB_012615 [Kipferlia bialata]|uniref:Uncharacterized protein n=1 Tax=Kipferlia bialata TaxID=797122 RepID=A0A391P0B0_9EUKA|nr:hypothetical protein KIPB_012615 [Kipferlia bialata]|eukprot:g12615.t1